MKNGKRVEVNLGVKIAGKPPMSLKVSDEGNPAFERSRAEAEAKLKELREEANKGRMDKFTAFHIYRERTGATIKETSIADLPNLIATENTQYGKWKRKIVANFVLWAEARGLNTVLDISADIAKEYLEHLYAFDDVGVSRTATTVRRSKAALGMVFDIALPEGAPNPFRARYVTITPHEDDREHHREPLTETEVEKLLEAAQSDGMTFDLIVCALSTGLRRGDVCQLKWDGVNLRTNTLRLTTHKTKADLYLPILPLFKTVLEKRLTEKSGTSPYVFPEAEKMLRENDTGLTWRIKKAFALALGDIPEAETTTPPNENLNDALPKVLKAISRKPMASSKRKTMIDFVTRYANGQSVRTIEKDAGKPRSTVSTLLNEAQRISGIRFIKGSNNGNGWVKKAIDAVTRVQRKHGMKSASKYDFHALRTTFVTIAIKNGFSIDKLRALTGHATVEIVMRHYFKPKGTDFSHELAQVMPQALTGIETVKQLPAPPVPKGKKKDNITTLLETLSDTEIAKLTKILRQRGTK